MADWYRDTPPQFAACKTCVCRDCTSKDHVGAGGCIACEVCSGDGMGDSCEYKEVSE
jgi:hypothetical protein